MKIDIKKLAKLANLTITPEEEKKYSQELGSTLDYINKLNGIDTTGVEPTNQVTGLENVMREDKAKPSLTQEEALSNVKSTENGYFTVKRILG